MSSRPPGRLIAAVRRLLLQADRGPVRRGCLACAEVFMRVVAAYLRLGLRASIYVRGGFGSGEPVLGLSDIDLIAVVGEENGADPRSRLMGRWQRLERRLPGLRRVAYLACYCESELQPLRRTRFTYGLDGHWPRSLLFGDSPRSSRRLEHRTLPWFLPDLWPIDCWRPISGPDLRPRKSASDPDHSHLLAWVHLHYWWVLGLRALTEPAAPWVTYACVKLVAEPAKILLWLERGEQHFVRREMLERALEVLPQEEATFSFALDLLGNLRNARAAPIETVWPCFVRLSERIAGRLSGDLESMGVSAVKLEGIASSETADGHGGPQPLGDWTALVFPPGREESFVVGARDAGDPSAVLAAAEASTPTCFVTLINGPLIVRPGRLGRTWFRLIDFAGTDPVSAALLGGQSVAAFPSAAGWSARHVAARAVAEHAAWLQLPSGRNAESGKVVADQLAGLFSAARAGLFLRSIQDGDPVLPVSFEATARAWAERVPTRRSAIEDAYDSHRTAVGGGREADRDVLRIAVGALDELGCYERSFPHLHSRQ